MFRPETRPPAGGKGSGTSPGFDVPPAGIPQAASPMGPEVLEVLVPARRAAFCCVTVSRPTNGQLTNGEGEGRDGGAYRKSRGRFRLFPFQNKCLKNIFHQLFGFIRIFYFSVYPL